MQFEFLPHTADAKFRAYGKTLEEKFANAALAMFSIIVNTKEIEPKMKKQIKIEAADEKSLLYNWLEELLFLVDTEEFMLNNIEKIKIEKREKFILEATVVGDKYKEKYEILGGIKAATYNEMEITDKYVQVVVDI